MQEKELIKGCTKNNVKFIINSIREICRIEKEDCQPIPQLKKELRTALKRKTVLGAFINGKLAGFVWFTFNRKVPYGVNYGDEKQSYCWVTWTYVDKKYRQIGIATKLYKEMEKTCKKHGIRTIILDVFTVNKKSMKFHSKLGYIPFLSLLRKKV